MSQYDPEQFGRLAERVDSLTRQVSLLTDQVTALVALVNQGRGAFWLAVCLGGTVGGAVTWLITKVGLDRLIK